MHSRLLRPAAALLTTALAASVLGIVPAAYAADGTITGAVTSSGTPLENAEVTVYRYDALDDDWYYFDDASTSDTGAYSLTLLEGEYRIGFQDFSGGYVEEFYDNAPDVDSPDAETVSVSAATPVVANADLEAAAHITGEVTGPGGAALEDIRVIVWKQVVEDAGTPDEYVDYWYAGGRSTDEFGAYDVGGLPGGTYRVEFADDTFAGDADYATEYYDNQLSLYSDTTEDLVVAPGATRGSVNAQLALDSEITGTVVDASDVPIAGAEVDVLVKDGNRWHYTGYAETDEFGDYEVDGLATGTYRVRFNATIGDDREVEYWQNVGRLGNATDVPVGLNVTVAEINAQLVAGEHDGEVAPSFTNTALPTISGPAVVGQTLSATTGAWTPTPTEFYYDWYRDGEYIDGVYASTYVLTADDLGKAISVGVAAGAEDSGYEYGYAESARTAPVTATAPVVTPTVVVTPPVVTPPVVTPLAPVVDLPTALAKALAAVKVKGRPKVGRTLKVANLDLDVRTAVTYKFQWFAGTKKITKATKSKLKVVRSMKGKKISVKVTGKAGATSKSVKIKVGKVR